MPATAAGLRSRCPGCVIAGWALAYVFQAASGGLKGISADGAEGLFGSLVGAVAGSLVARAVPGLLADVLPVTVEVGWQGGAMLRGIALGVGVAALFGLRPLIDVLRVPPVRVLRRDADPLPVSRTAATGLATVLAVGVAVVIACRRAPWSGVSAPVSASIARRTASIDPKTLRSACAREYSPSRRKAVRSACVFDLRNSR